MAKTALTLKPIEGEVRVLVSAVGVTALGTQVAGTIDAVGPDSVGFARKDRVAFRSSRPVNGSRIVVDEHDLIGVPADVSLDAAAALLPCALLARTVIKQVHVIGKGDRVRVTDESVVAPFIRAWVSYIGATLVTDEPSVTVTGADIRSALAWRSGHGLAQQAAADVFAALRAGAFVGIELSTPEQARKGSRHPVLLHPAEVSLAA